jgi:lipoprotein-anchoring transpeptidase ErfK/SrfK
LTSGPPIDWISVVPKLGPTAVGLVAALAATGIAAADVPPPEQPASPTESMAWTARVVYPVPARSAPRPDAREVTPVFHYTAFSRRPQVLLVTGAATSPDGRSRWVRVLLPRRPNGTQAWIPRAAVELSTTTLRLRVRLEAHRVEVWRAGRLAASYPAAVGTGSTPTPVGLFAIQDPVASNAEQRSYLGPYILTLTAHSAVLRAFMGGDGLVAIHGTNAPGLLGGNVSHGCIRVSNGAVMALHRLVKPGTPVEVVRT